MTDLELYYQFLRKSEDALSNSYEFRPKSFECIINYAIYFIKDDDVDERDNNIVRYAIISPNMYKLREELDKNFLLIDETNKTDMQLVYKCDEYNLYTHMLLPDYSPVVIGRDEAYNGSKTYFLNFTPPQREYSLNNCNNHACVNDGFDEPMSTFIYNTYNWSEAKKC
jgi:hypothetical protein